MWSWIAAACILFITCIVAIVVLGILLKYQSDFLMAIRKQRDFYMENYFSSEKERNDLYAQLMLKKRDINIQMEVPTMSFNVRDVR